MTSITIPFHLLMPVVVGLVGLTFMLLKRRTLRKKNVALYQSGLIFLFACTLLVGNALGHDLYYQWDLNRYDLNQDGFFSHPETTPGQQRAMERLTHDVGRNFAFSSSFIVSAILATTIYILEKISHALFGIEDTEMKNEHSKNIHTQ